MPPNEATILCYIVRHGQTVLNRDRCFRGNANPPLDETGIKQAHTLASLFEPIEISHIFCSDKQRSIKTAEIIAQAKDATVYKSEGLRALDVGEFSGQKRTPETESQLQQYLDDPDTVIPGGESLTQFKSRIQPCIEEAIDLFDTCGDPPMLVAHSSVVHEAGSIIYGDHKKILVEPGGAIAIYALNGKLGAEPIFRPLKVAPGTHAQTIT
jgi:alpha-ribazole phosphatase